MKHEEKRSLYQCFNVKVKGKELRCSKGHKFPLSASTVSLAKGKPLVLACCQNCEDYDEMGPPVPADERGWLNLTPEKA